MKRSHRLIRQAMQELQEATRPKLSEVTGLSLVSVNKAVAELSNTGELLHCSLIPSGGGRPVQLYRYNSRHGQHALIQISNKNSTWIGKMELLDLQGVPQQQFEGRFAYIDTESFDGWLDEATAKQKLSSITLYFGGESTNTTLAEHLKARYHCPVRTPSTASVLAPRTDGYVSICFPIGQAITCAMFRGEHMHECGPLELLPLPVRWQELDHSDHTLKEETVARLLQIISCTLAPQCIYLHTPAWSSRLMERIRYNAQTKMRGALPPIRFLPLTEAALRQALYRYAATIH